MKLIPCDSSIFEMIHRAKYGENQELLLAFSKMGKRCCQVSGVKQNTPAYNKTASLNRAVKSMHLDHIKAVTFRNNVYLVNELIDDTQN